MSITTPKPAGEIAAFLGGFIAGEGHFHRGPPTWSCAVGLGASDAGMCSMLQGVLGVGSIRTYPRRKPHYDDEVVWAVRSLPDLVNVIVPFLDDHLPPSYKRQQYEAWRAGLLEYWEHKAKRRRPCIVEGCERPRRAKELCRRHYYEAYGR